MKSDKVDGHKVNALYNNDTYFPKTFQKNDLDCNLKIKANCFLHCHGLVSFERDHTSCCNDPLISLNTGTVPNPCTLPTDLNPHMECD